MSENPQEGEEQPAPASAALPDVKLVGIIELGTTSLRMCIAQIEKGGATRLLDNVQQPVSLGKEAFTTGSIGMETTEACVNVLRGFRRMLLEYRATDDRDIMAVATSAVREAQNRDTFLDRLYIATGIHVRVLDEAEVSRFTYLAVQPLLEKEPALREADSLVVEVGGGSTEVLVFRKGQVVSSHTYQLGSLRLRQSVELGGAPASQWGRILRSEIDGAVRELLYNLNIKPGNLVVMGGDARFACVRLSGDTPAGGLTKLDAGAVGKLAGQVLAMSVDDVVRRFHMSYPDADTLGPALLVVQRLARALDVSSVLVGHATLRDGMLAEMAARGSRSEDFMRQVINSAVEIGAKYRFDREHGERVASAARDLFDAMWDEHLLDARHEMILTVAAWLHEIGKFVSHRSHHKHSMYLIMNSDVLGLGTRDLLLAALVARYHRKALPQPTHEYYSTLDREDRVAVAKMAALLRVADALCAGDSRQRRKLNLTVEPGKLTIAVEDEGDLTLEQHALRQKGDDMFERVYGMKVVLRSAGRSSRNGGT